MCDETIQVREAGRRDAEVPLADVVDGLVIHLGNRMNDNPGEDADTSEDTHHEGAIRVLEGRVRGENRVVRLDDRAGQLWSRVHTELKLGLLAVIRRQTLQQQSAEPRPGTSSKGMENEESLETRTVIRQTTELIHHGIDELLSDGVVSASIYAEVGCVRQIARYHTTMTLAYNCSPRPPSR